MSYRKILEWPNKILALNAKPIEEFGTTGLKNILIDMEDTLKVKSGLGLAAPQIGESIRAVVIDTTLLDFENPDKDSSCLDKQELWILLNPVLSNTEGSQKWEEGCLSVPWHTVYVDRPLSLKLEYQNFNGDFKSLTLSWPTSAVVQHECDHLDGTLVLDKISRLKSRRIKNSINKKRKKIQDIKNSLYSETDSDTIGKPKNRLSLSSKEIKKRKKIKKNNR